MGRSKVDTRVCRDQKDSKTGFGESRVKYGDSLHDGIQPCRFRFIAGSQYTEQGMTISIRRSLEVLNSWVFWKSRKVISHGALFSTAPGQV